MTITRERARSTRCGAIRTKTRVWASIALVATLSAGTARAQTPIPPAAADFAMSAAQSDQYEIHAAQDAITQSQNPSVRAFAQAMIQDHTRTSASLRQAAVSSGLTPPPPAMSSDQAAMLAALQGLRGADFDKTYARQQVLAHHQALAVDQSYANAGTDANLRKAAQSAVPVIRRHLSMAQALSTGLGGS
jgi:putative membrane protein